MFAAWKAGDAYIISEHPTFSMAIFISAGIPVQ